MEGFSVASCMYLLRMIRKGKRSAKERIKDFVEIIMLYYLPCETFFSDVDTRS